MRASASSVNSGKPGGVHTATVSAPGVRHTQPSGSALSTNSGHQLRNCSRRRSRSGNAQLHTGSSKKATAIVSTTASRSPAPATCGVSPMPSRYRAAAPPGTRNTAALACREMPDIVVPFFTALPAAPPPWPGVIAVMEGGGISPQLLRVCERLAHEGYATIAPDLFWRFGGSDPDKAQQHYPALRHADGRADIVDCIGWLRAIGATKVGITGFCMGGGYAYLAAISGDVDAAAPFYGGGIAQHLGDRAVPAARVLRRARRMDPPRRHREGRTTPSRRRDRLRRRGARVHARRLRQLSRNSRATDAWTRMLAFFAQHLQEH